MSQDVQAESQVEKYDSSQLHSTVVKLVKDAMRENFKSITSQEIDMKTTVYSTPDSLGKQYIVETQISKIKTKIEEDKNIAMEYSGKTEEKVDSTSISASIEDLEMESSTEIEEKRGLPWWQKILMFIGAAVLIIIVIRIALKLI